MAVTDVSTGLPDTELSTGSTITVDTGTALAKVTLLNVYGISPTGEQITVTVPVYPLFAYGPGE